MADLMYPMRLYWNGMTGFAKCDEVRASLKHPPRVPGIARVFEIDFAPSLCAELRETSSSEKREMTAEEIDAATKHLHAMATMARDILDGETSLATVVLR